MEENMEIIEYVKDRKNRKVGVLLGSLIDEKISIGWSQAHIALDKFNSEKGKKIARGRLQGWGYNVTVPHIIHKRMKKFVNRCQRYFKGKLLKSNIYQIFANSTGNNEKNEANQNK